MITANEMSHLIQSLIATPEDTQEFPAYVNFRNELTNADLAEERLPFLELCQTTLDRLEMTTPQLTENPNVIYLKSFLLSRQANPHYLLATILLNKPSLNNHIPSIFLAAELIVRQSQFGQDRANDDRCSSKIRQTAEQGFPEAMHLLGYWLTLGDNPAKNSAGVTWLQKAANTGHTPSMVKLGSLYWQGKGVPVDQDLAAKWYGEAVAKKHPKAKSQLRIMLNRGYSLTPEGAKKLGATAIQSLTIEMTCLALEKINTPENEEGLHLLQTAAHYGHVGAMCILGDISQKKGDTTQAIDWLRKAAKKNHHSAILQLGQMLHPTSPVEAIQWLEYAAQQNYLPAMVEAGNKLLNLEQASIEEIARGINWLCSAVQKDVPEGSSYVRASQILTRLFQSMDKPIRDKALRALECALHKYQINYISVPTSLHQTADNQNYLAPLLTSPYLTKVICFGLVPQVPWYRTPITDHLTKNHRLHGAINLTQQILGYLEILPSLSPELYTWLNTHLIFPGFKHLLDDLEHGLTCQHVKANELIKGLFAKFIEHRLHPRINEAFVEISGRLLKPCYKDIKPSMVAYDKTRLPDAVQQSAGMVERIAELSNSQRTLEEENTQLRAKVDQLSTSLAQLEQKVAASEQKKRSREAPGGKLPGSKRAKTTGAAATTSTSEATFFTPSF